MLQRGTFPTYIWINISLHHFLKRAFFKQYSHTNLWLQNGLTNLDFFITLPSLRCWMVELDCFFTLPTLGCFLRTWDVSEPSTRNDFSQRSQSNPFGWYSLGCRFFTCLLRLSIRVKVVLQISHVNDMLTVQGSLSEWGNEKNRLYL